jgi:hypothetical protein
MCKTPIQSYIRLVAYLAYVYTLCLTSFWIYIRKGVGGLTAFCVSEFPVKLDPGACVRMTRHSRLALRHVHGGEMEVEVISRLKGF